MSKTFLRAVREKEKEKMRVNKKEKISQKNVVLILDAVESIRMTIKMLYDTRLTIKENQYGEFEAYIIKKNDLKENDLRPRIMFSRQGRTMISLDEQNPIKVRFVRKNKVNTGHIYVNKTTFSNELIETIQSTKFFMLKEKERPDTNLKWAYVDYLESEEVKILNLTSAIENGSFHKIIFDILSETFKLKLE